jgi:hypothetical protein
MDGWTDGGGCMMRDMKLTKNSHNFFPQEARSKTTKTTTTATTTTTIRRLRYLDMLVFETSQCHTPNEFAQSTSLTMQLSHS